MTIFIQEALPGPASPLDVFSIRGADSFSSLAAPLSCASFDGSVRDKNELHGEGVNAQFSMKKAWKTGEDPDSPEASCTTPIKNEIMFRK